MKNRQKIKIPIRMQFFYNFLYNNHKLYGIHSFDHTTEDSKKGQKRDKKGKNLKLHLVMPFFLHNFLYDTKKTYRLLFFNL